MIVLGLNDVLDIPTLPCDLTATRTVPTQDSSKLLTGAMERLKSD